MKNEFDKVVYGPMKSRRLGLSLGINISPIEKKVCSFDCIYCSEGPTKIKGMKINSKDSFSIDFIKYNMEKGLAHYSKKKHLIDFITFSGATESTIHPYFPEIVNYFFDIKNKYFKETPTAIITNSSNLGKEKIKKTIERFDRQFFKLDAADEETFQKINRPAKGVTLVSIVENLSKIQNIELTSGVIDSSYGNYNSLKSQTFINILIKLNPKRFYVYDMDRPSPTNCGFKMMRTSEKRLMEFADYVSINTGIEVNVLRSKKSRGIHPLVKDLYSF